VRHELGADPGRRADEQAMSTPASLRRSSPVAGQLATSPTRTMMVAVAAVVNTPSNMKAFEPRRSASPWPAPTRRGARG